MRARAFRPEAPGCLETRALLSGTAGHLPHPVKIPDRAIAKIDQQIRQGFHLFIRDRNVDGMLDEIYDGAVLIPYGKADGLGVTIRRRVEQMQRDIDAGVPHPVIRAQRDIEAAIHAQIVARVRAGDVVVQA